jgi:hypothetical protein
MNWKGCARKRSRPDHGTIVAFPGGNEENHRKTLVTIVGFLAEIRTEHLLNTSLELLLKPARLVQNSHSTDIQSYDHLTISPVFYPLLVKSRMLHDYVIVPHLDFYCRLILKPH